jgi:hypothetical protein
VCKTDPLGQRGTYAARAIDANRALAKVASDGRRAGRIPATGTKLSQERCRPNRGRARAPASPAKIARIEPQDLTRGDSAAIFSAAAMRVGRDALTRLVDGAIGGPLNGAMAHFRVDSRSPGRNATDKPCRLSLDGFFVSRRGDGRTEDHRDAERAPDDHGWQAVGMAIKAHHSDAGRLDGQGSVPA